MNPNKNAHLSNSEGFRLRFFAIYGWVAKKKNIRKYEA